MATKTAKVNIVFTNNTGSPVKVTTFITGRKSITRTLDKISETASYDVNVGDTVEAKDADGNLLATYLVPA